MSAEAPERVIEITQLPDPELAPPCELLWWAFGDPLPCGQPATTRVRVKCLPCASESTAFVCNRCLLMIVNGQVQHSNVCKDAPVIVRYL